MAEYLERVRVEYELEKIASCSSDKASVMVKGRKDAGVLGFVLSKLTSPITFTLVYVAHYQSRLCGPRCAQLSHKG